MSRHSGSNQGMTEIWRAEALSQDHPSSTVHPKNRKLTAGTTASTGSHLGSQSPKPQLAEYAVPAIRLNGIFSRMSSGRRVMGVGGWVLGVGCWVRSDGRL